MNYDKGDLLGYCSIQFVLCIQEGEFNPSKRAYLFSLTRG
jgi:hypothetical protein